jgi:hypothetical protein
MSREVAWLFIPCRRWFEPQGRHQHDDAGGQPDALDGPVPMVAHGARRDLSLSGHKPGGPGLDEVSDEVNVMRGDASSAGITDDVRQLDEGARVRRCWVVIERTGLDRCFVGRAQPNPSTERCEHRVGDDRRCGRPPSPLDVERRDGDPECTDCFTDGISVLAEASVSPAGRQDAREEALHEQPAGQSVVSRQGHERTQQLLAGVAPLGVGGRDDLIEVVDVADRSRKTGGEPFLPQAGLPKCPRTLAQPGPFPIELGGEAVARGRVDRRRRSAVFGKMSS